jgi:hypothetical protein
MRCSAPLTSYRHVATLGSSFAAGPGIPPIVDRFTQRSGRNYARCGRRPNNRLVGLEGFGVKRVIEVGDRLDLEVELVGRAGCCPRCGRASLEVIFRRRPHHTEAAPQTLSRAAS